jgi:hypothetical protein
LNGQLLLLSGRVFFNYWRQAHGTGWDYSVTTVSFPQELQRSDKG